MNTKTKVVLGALFLIGGIIILKYSFSSNPKNEGKEDNNNSGRIISDEMVKLRQIVSTLETEASEALPAELKPSLDQLAIPESEKSKLESLLDGETLSPIGSSVENMDVNSVFKSNVEKVNSEIKLNEIRTKSLREKLNKKHREIKTREKDFDKIMSENKKKHDAAIKETESISSLLEKSELNSENAFKNIETSNENFRKEKAEAVDTLNKLVKDIAKIESEKKNFERVIEATTKQIYKHRKEQNRCNGKLRRTRSLRDKRRLKSCVNSQGKQVYNLTKNLDPVLKQLASAKGNIVKRKEILDRKQKEISDRNVASNKTKETMKSEYGIFTKQSEILDKNVVALNDLQETLRTKRTKEIDLEKTRLVKFDKEVGELEDMIVESENKDSELISKLKDANKTYKAEVERVRNIAERKKKEKESLIRIKMEMVRQDEKIKQDHLEKLEKRILNEKAAEIEDKLIEEMIEKNRLAEEKDALERETATRLAIKEENLRFEKERKKLEEKELELRRVENEKAEIEAEERKKSEKAERQRIDAEKRQAAMDAYVATLDPVILAKIEDMMGSPITEIDDFGIVKLGRSKLSKIFSYIQTQDMTSFKRWTPFFVSLYLNVESKFILDNFKVNLEGRIDYKRISELEIGQLELISRYFENSGDTRKKIRVDEILATKQKKIQDKKEEEYRLEEYERESAEKIMAEKIMAEESDKKAADEKIRLEKEEKRRIQRQKHQAKIDAFFNGMDPVIRAKLEGFTKADLKEVSGDFMVKMGRDTLTDMFNYIKTQDMSTFDKWVPGFMEIYLHVEAQFIKETIGVDVGVIRQQQISGLSIPNLILLNNYFSARGQQTGVSKYTKETLERKTEARNASLKKEEEASNLLLEREAEEKERLILETNRKEEERIASEKKEIEDEKIRIEEAKEAAIEQAKIQEEAKMIEEALLIEDKRLKLIARAKKDAEDKRVADEKAKKEARIIADAKLAEEARAATQAKLAEDTRVREVARLEAEAKSREEARVISEEKLIAEAKARQEALSKAKNEEERIQAEKDAVFKEAQDKEKARKVEIDRINEEARIKEEYRIKEEERLIIDAKIIADAGEKAVSESSTIVPEEEESTPEVEPKPLPFKRSNKAGRVKTKVIENENGSSTFSMNVPNDLEEGASDDISIVVTPKSQKTLEEYNAVFKKIQTEGTIQNLTKKEKDTISKAGKVFDNIKETYVTQKKSKILERSSIDN